MGEEIESLSMGVSKKVSMASDRMWGGLPFMVPSKTAMKYLHHAKVIPEEDVPVGAHYRAREDMLQNVRGYRLVKKGLSRRLLDIEHEKRRAKSEVPFISTSGVSASYLSGGHEHWAPTTTTKSLAVFATLLPDVPSSKVESQLATLNQGLKNTWDWLTSGRNWLKILVRNKIIYETKTS